MLEGRRVVAEQEMERMAWMVAHLLAPYSEKPISVDDLLGRERKVTRKETEQAADRLQYHKDLLRKIETGRVLRRDVIKTGFK